MTSTILVVDDDPPHRHLIGMLLEEQVDDPATRIETVSSGPEALERLPAMLEAGRVLVLSDYVMPEMSGLDLLVECRERFDGADMRFLVLSSVQQVVDMEALETAGAHEFIVKPYDLEDYIAMLRRVLSEWGGVRLTAEATV